ncbi:SID1 transmembrane family member 1-like isoform X2 [Cylas formicarius]|nr:SID1 transmembrane family member 1-like isoform X2 [Cylas formicarius]
MVTSQDSICTVVSIQNVSCPVFDLNEDITFRGFYETFDMRGGITIPKDKFPYGFFVVFVAKADDSQCSQTPTIPSSDNRTKSITVEIKPSISYKDYTNAVIWTLCSIGAFYVVFAIAFALCTRRCWEPRRLEYAEAVVPTNSDAAQTRSLAGSEDSESIDEVDSQRNFPYDRETRRCKIQPCLEDLALRHPRILAKKSYLYLYNVLTVGLFYALPVVQLVVTYQGVLNETGQQDLCYYNFLCSHPLGVLSDFNHVFSNVGYVLLGLLFLAITFFRERTHCDDADFDRHYGIPQHYGLFYAMGVALIMEGVLSGSYHVCPSQSNFQFDTSFMYVMAVLCMIKLYQNRHPDINANAYATFGVLAVAILLGMIGLFEGTESFWMFFAVVHILSCLYLSLKVYYMGCWSISTTSLTRMWHTLRHDFSSGPLNVFVPSYKARFCVLLFANACNWALAYVAVQYRPQNFAVFLLLVFMSNTLLYFIFYIVMKYVNKERVRIVCWIFLIASTLCAISAMYFFLHKSISWSATPAKSRHFNTECTLLRFYDYHDVWHFLSAVGMFFTFMVLLTLDDDISHTHRSRISVF